MLIRAYLVTAPDWVRGLVAGLLFGAVMTVGPWSDYHNGWAPRIIIGVIEGAIFGVLMGLHAKRRFGAIRSELASLPFDQRKTAMRAAVRGPAPAEPATRAAALHYVEHRRELTKRQWWSGIAVYGVALVAAAVLALTDSPWWWISCAFFAPLLIGLLLSPRRFRSRIAVLSEGAPAASA